MPKAGYFKHLREEEDLSKNEISRKIGCNWRTVKKYADEDSFAMAIALILFLGGFYVLKNSCRWLWLKNA